ncbi:MAG TPA: choice-of-anchor tandem repeat GloVer-containing protein [Rhizomicrobium sp.]|nr:choice-of-anchor tandem repeat GloVer-containing protein [Rhizomicrobium sp.]
MTLTHFGRTGWYWIGSALIASIISLCASPAESAEKVIYAFQGGADGMDPGTPLIMDSSGSLYGMTALGGGSTQCASGCGTVFRLTPDGAETVLHAFDNTDGALPSSNLIFDGSGNLYGTTSNGGSFNRGTLFELASDGTETVLYTFAGGSDGSEPSGNLIRDKNGNFYGTTPFGGSTSGSDCSSVGCGTVFKVAFDGAETVVYSFEGGTDGFQPSGGLISDTNGNRYGTTVAGGTGNGNNCGGGDFGCGTIFRIAPDGTETVLYSFQGGSDGFGPVGALARDKSGNMFGTTGGGGSNGQGTVFEFSSIGTETVLYSFKGGNDGSSPFAGVIMDKDGNLYGTTYYGGGTKCRGAGCGTVFKLAPDGSETVLVAFGHLLAGRNPEAALLKGSHGLLYGTASAGGTSNEGIVFSVKK